MVLGKLPVPGRPTIWITVGQGPTALAVGAGGGCLDIFTLIYPFSPLSPSLWETIYTEILSQRAVKAKTTNQPTYLECKKFKFCMLSSDFQTCPCLFLLLHLSLSYSMYLHGFPIYFLRKSTEIIKNNVILF